MPTFEFPWNGLSCDFITDLPISNGRNLILIFINWMSKMTHFMSYLKSTSTPNFTDLFVFHIVRLYGLPNSIVSDYVIIFMSKFWSTLSLFYKLMLGNPQHFICKLIVKQSVWIKLLNNIFKSITIINKTISPIYFLSLNSLTIIWFKYL